MAMALILKAGRNIITSSRRLIRQTNIKRSMAARVNLYDAYVATVGVKRRLSNGNNAGGDIAL